jgi:hypothetical protein
MDCKYYGIPLKPDPCINSEKCFENAKKMINKCNQMFGGIASIAKKWACIRCTETYAGSCPGKKPASECTNQDCNKPGDKG